MTMDDVLMTPERWQDRWEAFKNEPQQVTAIWKLYDAIKQSDPALLSESAEWASKFSETPPQVQQQVIAVPYFCQLLMDDGQGWRDCFSTTAAMIAAWKGKVPPNTTGENQYNHIRQKHGDSTVAGSQLAALAELGLHANYATNGTKAKLIELLDQGVPVGTGILHHGQASSPSGGGHWMLIVGYDEQGVIALDPYGELNVVNGTWARQGSGGDHVHYSWKNWLPRWIVQGGDGYMLWVA
jgi:hypothetical protein